MRKVFAGVLLMIGFLLIIIGTTSYLYLEEKAKLSDKIVSGDYDGVLEYIAALRTKPWFFALEAIPNLNGDLLMKEGWSLYKTGDRDGSSKKFRDAAKISSHYQGNALFNAATIDLSPETFESVITDYEKVLAIDSVNTFAQRNLEILRRIKEEQTDLRGGDSNKDSEDKSKNRSRTKEKLEYRDSDSENKSSSSSIRY